MLNGTARQPSTTTTSADPDPSQPSRSQPMLPIRQLGARSSILSHSFPSFYACYLLKSIQTPQSTAVYIGSTPSPPRRIRQHNGEIAQGARKTQSKRPWVMQMIVHGFPSRLAALQFEWAWQHPHRSRHLRDANGHLFGSKSWLMKKTVAIVRAMIARHPFSTWPLHVKLFTEEAVQCWDASTRMPQVLPLPSGFTCSVELEGVDGKSGHPGSGRQGPIAADDEEFTASLLAKNTSLIASGRPLECSVCHEPIHTHVNDPLSTALCPHTGCVAISHLTCLGQKFLQEETETKNMIPRGGNCPSCGTYTLWGDIIRGCYRRLPPADRNTPGLPDIASDDMFVTDEDDMDELSEATSKKHKSPSSPRRSSTRRRRSRKQKGKAKATESSEGESFDFDNISSSSESDNVTPMKRKPGRPRLNVKSPSAAILPPDSTPKARKKRTPSPPIASNSPKTKRKAPNLDSDSVAPAKRSPGRPRKIVAFAFLDSPSPVRSPFNIKQASSSTTATAEKGKGRRGRPKGSSASSSSSSEGEIFDFTRAVSSSESDGVTPMKRKPGRPRLNAKSSSAATLLPDITPATCKRRTPSPSKASSSTNTDLNGKIEVSNLSTPNRESDPLNANRNPVAPVKRSPGRPRKTVAPISPGGSCPAPSPTNIEHASSTKMITAEKGKKKRGRPEGGSVRNSSSSEGEIFDFTNVGSSSQSEGVTPVKRKPGRPRLNANSPSTTSLPPTKASNLSKPNNEDTSNLSNFNNIVSSSQIDPVAPVKRSPGRPCKIMAFIPADAIIPPTKIKQASSSKIDTVEKGKEKAGRPKGAVTNSSTGSGEVKIFDIASNSGSDDAVRPKRKVGRPCKNSSSLLDIRSPVVEHKTHSPPSAKRKVGRPRKNSFPLPDLQSHLPFQAQDIPGPIHGRPYTTSRLQSKPISADGSLDIETLHHVHGTGYDTSGRTLDYDTQKFSTPARTSSSPDSCLDNTFERAMSTQSLSTPSWTPVSFDKSKDKRGEDVEVIVLSD